MSTVSPIGARQIGDVCRLLEERDFGKEDVRRTLGERPNESVALLKALDANPAVMADIVGIFTADRVLLAAKVAEAKAELDARPKYGDHLLAERGISVIAGAQRGQTIPEGTALTELKPVGFLRKGDGDWISGTQVQDRALDESGPCYAPWGRGLLWRVFNNKEGEGDAFLGTLDKNKYYVFAGDRDLQYSDGDAVMLCLDYYGGQWHWHCYYVDDGDWDANVQLFTLGNSSS